MDFCTKSCNRSKRKETVQIVPLTALLPTQTAPARPNPTSNGIKAAFRNEVSKTFCTNGHFMKLRRLCTNFAFSLTSLQANPCVIQENSNVTKIDSNHM